MIDIVSEKEKIYKNKSSNIFILGNIIKKRKEKKLNKKIQEYLYTTDIDKNFIIDLYEIYEIIKHNTYILYNCKYRFEMILIRNGIVLKVEDLEKGLTIRISSKFNESYMNLTLISQASRRDISTKYINALSSIGTTIAKALDEYFKMYLMSEM